ncbi:hypothetical protein ACFPN7_49090 [Amycolatopsis halotolerans]|uniref:hypothetical protein n=1 Tax=Amycolatopsis halotolerans TaxID=330083 RepID=UPI00361731CE
MSYGASPRASLGIIAAARALALVRGRDYVLPQDVVDVVPDCCATGSCCPTTRWPTACRWTTSSPASCRPCRCAGSARPQGGAGPVPAGAPVR